MCILFKTFHFINLKLYNFHEKFSSETYDAYISIHLPTITYTR